MPSKEKSEKLWSPETPEQPKDTTEKSFEDLGEQRMNEAIEAARKAASNAREKVSGLGGWLRGSLRKVAFGAIGRTDHAARKGAEKGKELAGKANDTYRKVEGAAVVVGSVIGWGLEAVGDTGSYLSEAATDAVVDLPGDIRNVATETAKGAVQFGVGAATLGAEAAVAAGRMGVEGARRVGEAGRKTAEEVSSRAEVAAAVSKEAAQYGLDKAKGYANIAAAAITGEVDVRTTQGKEFVGDVVKGVYGYGEDGMNLLEAALNKVETAKVTAKETLATAEKGFWGKVRDAQVSFLRKVLGLTEGIKNTNEDVAKKAQGLLKNYDSFANLDTQDLKPQAESSAQ